MKAFVYSTRPYEQPELYHAAIGKHELLFTEQSLNRDTAHHARNCSAISIFTSDDASADVLEELWACGVRYIALRSVGYDHVDINKAHELGIRVAHVPEYSPYSVAEHAVALLLAMNRKIVEGQLLMQLQDYRIDTLKGFDIHGKTVGIIGAGKIGLAFARIMLGFGARLLAHDPSRVSEVTELGISYVTLEELLRQSDIVSIHCPLTPKTRHLVAGPQFQLMKKGAILINTSRGTVINTADLIEALNNGRLGAACLDVYENEKDLFFNDLRNAILKDEMFTRLRSFKNVIITGHQAFLTQEAIEAIAATTISNLDAWDKKTQCVNEIPATYAVIENK
jgi:D-lactate dehydrogenase